MPASLAVRPMAPDEAPLVVRYFLDASPEDIARMGVDPTKLPDAAAWERSLRETFGPAYAEYARKVPIWRWVVAGWRPYLPDLGEATAAA